MSPVLLGAIALATLLGTLLGTRILARLSERSFQQLSRRLLDAIGVAYLCKAGFSLL